MKLSAGLSGYLLMPLISATADLCCQEKKHKIQSDDGMKKVQKKDFCAAAEAKAKDRMLCGVYR